MTGALAGLTRPTAMLRLDLRLQVRYGIMPAAAAVSLLWIVLLRLLPASARDVAVPLVVFGDLAIIGFYFIGGMVLFEKAEATLSALATSPLRFGEYLGARIAALTLLAAASTLAVIGGAHGFKAHLGLLLICVGLLSVISLLVGFIAVAPFDSVSRYILPSAVPLLVLGLPLLDRLGVVGGPLLLALPTQGAMVFLHAAFDGDQSAAHLLAAATSSALWIAGLWAAAGRAARRWILPAQGGP